MVQVTSVQLEDYRNAITPTLLLKVGVLNNTTNRYSIVDGGGEIFAREGGRISSIVYTTGPTAWEPQQALDVVFAVELGREKLERLEEIRGGGDFYYRARAFLTVLNRNNNEYERVPIDIGEPEARVPRSDWARMLRDSGFTDLRIVEVRFPVGPERQVFENAQQHFEMALGHYNSGVWRSAIASSRDVVRTFIGEDSAQFEEVLGEEKWTRMRDIIGKASHFMSVGTHPEEEIPYRELTRHDAEVSMLIAQAVLKYLSEAVSATAGT